MVSMFNINCSKLFQNQIDDKHMTRGLIQEVKSFMDREQETM